MPSDQSKEYVITVSFQDDGEVIVGTYVEGEKEPIYEDRGYDLGWLVPAAQNAIVDHRNGDR